MGEVLLDLHAREGRRLVELERTALRQSLGKSEESEIYPKDSGEPLKELWKEEQSIVVFAFKKMSLSAAQQL